MWVCSEPDTEPIQNKMCLSCYLQTVQFSLGRGDEILFLLRSAQSSQLFDVDISLLLSSGSESKPWTAWEQAPLVTPLSWRQSPCPLSHPAWSAPPSATRPSGSSGATAQPKPPPQTPSSISCRWGTRAAGQWPISHARGSDLTRDKPIREETGVWAKASDNYTEGGA